MPIAQLSVDLVASLAKFDQGMREAVSSSEKAAKKIEASFGRLKEFGKGLAVSLLSIEGGKAFAAFINDAADARAQLYGLHLQTGMTVQALGALRDVAAQSKTDLTTVASASNKLSKGLATSDENARGAATALKALGINFSEFKRLLPEQQLFEVSKKLNGFANDGGKAATAMLLFGKSRAALLPFLEQLAQRTDLASGQTTEAAKRAKEYADNLVKLQIAAADVREDLAGPLIDALTELTGTFIKARKLGIDPFHAGLASLGQVVAANLGLDEVGKLESRAKAIAAEMERVTNIFVGVSNVLEREPNNEVAKRRYVVLSEQLRDLRRQALQASEALKNVAGVPKKEEPETKPKLKTFVPDEKAAEAYAALIKQIQEKIAVDQAQLEAVEKLTEGQKLQLKVFADIDGGFVKLTLDQKLAVDGMLQQVLAIEKLNRAKEAEVKWLKETGDENAHYIESQMQLRDMLQSQAGDALSRLDAYGLTAEALHELEAARLRDAAASLRQKAAQADRAWLEESARLFREQADAIDATVAARDALAARDAHERNDPFAGLTAGAKEYLQLVKEAGTATHHFVGGALSTFENDLTASLSNSKANFKSFIDFTRQEIYRLLLVRPALAELSKQLEELGRGGGSSGGLIGSVLKLFGGGSANAFGGSASAGFGSGAGYGNADLGVFLADGTNKVPYDGMKAVLHKGEAVVPAKYNPAAGGGAGASRPPDEIQIINNGAPVSARQETQQKPDGSYLRRLILDTVADDLVRGGKVSQTGQSKMGWSRQLDKRG